MKLPASTLAVQIGVFGLFHPAELRVRPAPGTVLTIEENGSRYTLEGARTATFGVNTRARITSRSGEFVLSVPGKIERRFTGVLSIEPAGRALNAMVEIDLETAVASVVAAESPPGASLEALKAQAVVARSFYAASGARHAAFAFCDTTHCQFLREAPAANSLAGRAARATRGLALTYQGKPFAAMYSASCGGGTRSLERPAAPGAYPYYAVRCVRGHASPRGHQLGLCQEGAAAMAAAGASFREILEHYYPNTSLENY